MLFKNPKKKLALFFSGLSSLLILLTTFITILLVKYDIDNQSKETLKSSLKTVTIAYQENMLQDQKANFLVNNAQPNSVVINYDDDKKTNSKDQAKTETSEAPMANNSTNKLKNESVEEKGLLETTPQNEDYTLAKDTTAERNFNTDASSNQERSYLAAKGANSELISVQTKKQVYSRIIKPDGEVIFSSDIFDSYDIPTSKGFKKILNSAAEIHVYTQKIEQGLQAGSIIQVAQFAPFEREDQLWLFGQIFLVTLFLIPLTYLVGVFGAGLLIKPLEKTTKQATEFTHDVYHELLTPISVAISSVEVAEATHDYKNGILSLKDDLFNIYQSLNLLKDKSINNKVQHSEEFVDLCKLINEILDNSKKQIDHKNLKFAINASESSVYKKIDRTTACMIFKNLIENAIKYSKDSSIITINLTSKNFSIENPLDLAMDLDVNKLFERGYRGKSSSLHIQGKGLGLAITKELVKELKWKVEVTLNKTFLIKIKF